MMIRYHLIGAEDGGCEMTEKPDGEYVSYEEAAIMLRIIKDCRTYLNDEKNEFAKVMRKEIDAFMERHNAAHDEGRK